MIATLKKYNLSIAFTEWTKTSKTMIKKIACKEFIKRYSLIFFLWLFFHEEIKSFKENDQINAVVKAFWLDKSKILRNIP